MYDDIITISIEEFCLIIGN